MIRRICVPPHMACSPPSAFAYCLLRARSCPPMEIVASRRCGPRNELVPRIPEHALPVCFTDLLTRLVNGWPQNRIDELMPWHWAPNNHPEIISRNQGWQSTAYDRSGP